jgi:SNF2 family DNA or RNA helicase
VQLYPFQQEAVDKFIDVPSVLIGDDMGLGKTVTAIGLDLAKREKYAGKFNGRPMTLVVTRTSVMGSWQRHYKAWAPELSTMVIDRKNRSAFANSFLKGEHDVYIIHWAAIRLVPELLQAKWFHIIGDEIHAIKNRKAQSTQAFKKIQTVFKVGLSGTAADNRPDDIWSILHWLYPRKWTSYHSFYKHHILFQEIVNEITGRRYKKILGVVNTEQFNKDIEPFYMRRLKEEVLDDLPEKTYTTIWCDLEPAQRRAYDQMRNNMLAWVGENEDQPVPAPVLIAQLIRLQQFAVAFGELIKKVVRKRKCEECQPRTCKHDMKRSICILCRDDFSVPCAGHDTFPLKLTEPSSKLDVVMDIVTDNPEKQFVVFGQSKQAIQLLAERLDKEGITPAVLTGDTPSDERDDLIDKFQSGYYRVFCATIRAGGEGITLTAADTIILIDRDWSPSKNRQVEDRVHRIGQRYPVQIIDLVARNTIDLGRHADIRRKWTWVRQMLGDINPEQAMLELAAAEKVKPVGRGTLQE